MKRRRFLELAAVSGLAAGCDRLIVLEPRADAELSPVSPIGEFYTYSYRQRPEFDDATHEMVLAYENVELARFGRTFLDTLTPVETEQTLQCIGSSPRVQRISNAVWSGLPLLEVFDALGVKVPESAIQLRMTGMDDYHAAIPITDLEEAPVWMMWGMNGEVLPFAHGAPARLLVRGRYGVKALKWIRELAFVDTPHVSHWTERNWSEEATYKPNTLIANPIDGVSVDGDAPVRIIGTAFAGEDPVVAVEASVDGGPWEPAQLDYEAGAGIWVLWSFDWTPIRGTHTIQMRCITESGAISDPSAGGTNRLNGYDGSMQISVRV